MNHTSERLTFFCQLCNTRIEGNICSEHGIDFVTIKKISVAEHAESVRPQEKENRANGMLQMEAENMPHAVAREGQIAVNGQTPVTTDSTYLPVIQTETADANALSEVGEKQAEPSARPVNAVPGGEQEEEYIFAKDAEYQELDEETAEYYAGQTQPHSREAARSNNMGLLMAVLAFVAIIVAAGIYFVAYHNPETAGTVYSRAESYYSTRQFSEARVLYQQIIDEYPENPLAQMAQQRILSIEPDKEGMTEISPEKQKQIQTLLVKANVAYQNQQFLSPDGDNVLFFTAKLLEMDPRNDTALTLQNRLFDHYDKLATASLNQQDYDRALSYYQSILRIRPGNEEILQKMRKVLVLKSSQLSESN